MYADSALNYYLKLKDTRYVGKAFIEKKKLELTRRVRSGDRGSSYVTLIADSFDTLLRIMPDFRQYEIVKVYPFNQNMVGMDVQFQLSKKQEIAANHGSIAHISGVPPLEQKTIDAMNTFENPERVKQLTRGCFKDSGFVFAQTYSVYPSGPDDVAVPPLMPVGDLGWHRNVVDEDTGYYAVEDLYVVQVWRSMFIPTRNSPRKGVGNNPFMLESIPKAISQELTLDRLHAHCMHPDYEYIDSVSFDKENARVPQGYYWQENVTLFGEHFGLLERKEGDDSKDLWSTHWRRPRRRPHADVDEVWLEPDVPVELLTKQKFGQMFGPVLPKGMAGIDFASGAIASIDWYGKVTYRKRYRDDYDGQPIPEALVQGDIEWDDETVLPIRTHEIFEAIQNFIKAHPETQPEQTPTKSE